MISVAQLMIDTAKLCTIPASLKEFVQLAEDPIAASTPLPGCGIDQIIAEGFIGKVITEENRGYIFTPRLGEPVILGKSIDQMRTYLTGDFRTASQIHNAYARYLVHENISQQVDDVVDPHKNSFISRLDSTTAKNLSEATEVLLGYAKRIKLKNG